MKRSVFFDDETMKQLEILDKAKNLTPNYSAVIRLAIRRLYEEEMKDHGGTIHTREDQPD